MNRIREFVKNNYKIFSFSLFINVVFFILFNLFFYCRYHTVDDVFMEMIACGAYDYPDYHLIYMNSLLGIVLSLLYRLFSFIPWFGIMHIVFALLSFSTITYVFLNRGNKISILLIIFTIIIGSYEAYTKVQFTKSASYLAAAGYCLIAYSFVSDNKKTNRIFGVVFLLLSFMTRTGMFLGCSAICAGMFVPMIIDYLRDYRNKDKLSNVVELIKVGAISLVLVIGVFAFDSLMYSSDEWSYYKQYNKYTTQFQDINLPDYGLFEKQYNDLGIDYNDYLLINSVDFNDPDVYNFETMEKIKQIQPYKIVDSNEIVMFILRAQRNLFYQKTTAGFTLMLMIILLVFVAMSKFDLSRFISAIYIFFATLVAFAYTSFMHGWFDRTTLAIMFSLLVSAIYVINPKQNKLTLGICSGLMAVLMICSIYSWNAYFKWNNQSWIEEVKTNQEVLAQIYEDSDHLYLSRTSLPVWKRYYGPYDIIRSGAMKNYSPLGDWIANMPLLVNTLERYDVVNPYKDMVNNDKVYFIGLPGDLDLVKQYISKHYYENVEFELVKNMANYEVYRIVNKQ